MRAEAVLLLALLSDWSSAAPKETREEVYSCDGLINIVKATVTAGEGPPARFQIALTHNKQETCLYWHSECPQLMNASTGTPPVSSCIEGLMWCLSKLPHHRHSCYKCDSVHGTCGTGFFLIEASQTTDLSSPCQATKPPASECFEEVSIDDSCTFPVDEGAATLCVGPEQTAAAQESVWIIATAVLTAVILALVAIAAVLIVGKIRHNRPPAGHLQPQGQHCNYGAMGREQPAQPQVPPPADAEPEQPQIVEDRRPPSPPPANPAANHEPPQAVDGVSEGTPSTEYTGTSAELIPHMGKGVMVWFKADSQSGTSTTLSPIVDPRPAKLSDSEEPKQTTSDSPQPASIETEDDKQASTPGEGDHEVSQLAVSTVGPLPSSKHPRRKHLSTGHADFKVTAGAKYLASSSSDTDSEAQRKKRPPKRERRPASESCDAAGLAQDMSTTNTSSEGSAVEKSTEVK